MMWTTVKHRVLKYSIFKLKLFFNYIYKQMWYQVNFVKIIKVWFKICCTTNLHGTIWQLKMCKNYYLKTVYITSFMVFNVQKNIYENIFLHNLQTSIYNQLTVRRRLLISVLPQKLLFFNLHLLCLNLLKKLFKHKNSFLILPLYIKTKATHCNLSVFWKSHSY